MKNIILVILLNICIINFSFANSCEEKIDISNVCNSEDCFSISEQTFWIGQEVIILKENEKIKVNDFKQFVKDELTLNVKKEIKWNKKYNLWEYCIIEEDANGDEQEICEKNDKELKFWNLLEVDEKFHIKKMFWDEEYIDWVHYFLENHEDIILKLKKNNSNIDSNFDEYITNLIDYEDLKFTFQNICNDDSCNSTEKKEIDYDIENTIELFVWEKDKINTSDQSFFYIDNSWINSNELKVWETFELSFDVNYEILEGCSDEIELKYEILYYKNWRWWNKQLYLKDFIIIRDKEILNLDNNWIKSYSFDENKINIKIKEAIRTNERGTFNYIVKISKNNLEKETLINNYRQKVIAWDPTMFDSYILFEFDEAEYYTMDNIFQWKLYLKDASWSPYFSKSTDQINFDSYSDEITLVSNLTKQTVYVGWKKVEYFDFNFQFNNTGQVPPLDWTISVNENIDDLKLDFVIDTDWNWINLEIFDPIWKEIKNIKCAKEVKLQAVCKQDIASWCSFEERKQLIYTSENRSEAESKKILEEEKLYNIENNFTFRIVDWGMPGEYNYKLYKVYPNAISFTNESENKTKFSLYVTDKAFNSIPITFHWEMDHVDRTWPVVDDSKTDKPSTQKAWVQDLEIYFNEVAPSWCQNNAEINLDFVVNWNTEYTKKYLNVWETEQFLNYWSILEDKVFTKTWDYNLKFNFSDYLWNTSNYDLPNFTIFPNDLKIINSHLTVSEGEKYANNSDFYEYTLALKDEYWNPIYWKKIFDLTHDKSISQKSEIILIDENSNQEWLNIECKNDCTSDWDWEIKFTVKSYAPWDFTESFAFKMFKWDNDYEDIGSKENYTISTNNLWTKTFKKPLIINEIKVSNWNNDNLEIWKNQKYKFLLNNAWNIIFNNWKIINLSDDNWLNFTSEHSFSGITNKDVNISPSDLAFWFDSFLKADSEASVLVWPKLKTTENLYVYYILKTSVWEDKYIKYPLNIKTLEWCNRSTLWLKVEWSIQWDWKSDITWQKQNFSDLTKSSIRADIRKNAHKLIANMQSGNISNEVKYIEWDIELYWEINWYETLIVKNGNVIINWDLNLWKNKLWIIVLKDNYNIVDDYNKFESWNIYINKDVKQINAIIYSDWVFRSADNNWNSYDDIELSENNLKLFWSLFTRNTVWWAVSAWEKFLLPWGKQTLDFNLAQIYDLNYVRKSMICWDDYSFLIKYNSSIQLNPPKGFSK